MKGVRKAKGSRGCGRRRSTGTLILAKIIFFSFLFWIQTSLLKYRLFPIYFQYLCHWQQEINWKQFALILINNEMFFLRKDFCKKCRIKWIIKIMWNICESDPPSTGRWFLHLFTRIMCWVLLMSSHTSVWHSSKTQVLIGF